MVCGLTLLYRQQFEEYHAATSLMSMKSCLLPFHHPSLGIKLPPLYSLSNDAKQSPSPREEYQSSEERSTIHPREAHSQCDGCHTPPPLQLAPMTPPMDYGRTFRGHNSSFPHQSFTPPHRDYQPAPFSTFDSPTLRLSNVKSVNTSHQSPAFARATLQTPTISPSVRCKSPTLSGANVAKHQLSSNVGVQDDSVGGMTTQHQIGAASHRFLKSQPQAVINDSSCKVRSSVQKVLSNRKMKLTIKKRSSTSRALMKWSHQLSLFLRKSQDELHHAFPGSILFTLPSDSPSLTSSSPSAESTRRRSSQPGKMSINRFLLPIDVATFKIGDWASLTDVGRPLPNEEFLSIHGCHYVSCVRWEKELWITK